MSEITEKPSLFAPFSPSVPYGMWGYSGMCCQIAIQRNNPDMAEECWRRGWMDGGTRMLIGTVLQEADRRAPAVAERLRKLGPTQVEPEMVG